MPFDGSKRIQNKYRPFKNGRESFDIVLKNIKKMSKFLPVQIRVTIVKEMIDKKVLREIINNLELKGIRNLVLSPVDCSKIGNTYFSLDENDLRKMNIFFEKVTEGNFKKMRKKPREKVIFDPFAPSIRSYFEGKWREYYTCGACFGMATVSTNGEIYPCHRFVGMKNFIIGNVFEGIYEDKILKFFKEYERIRNKCANCWLYKICGGFCYYYLAREDGTFTSPSPWLCNLRKKEYKTAMYFMIKYHEEIFQPPYHYHYITMTRHL